MELRDYQIRAIDALWSHIRTRTDHPCVVLPTGAGKGVILAKIAQDVVGWKGRLIILSHVRELLEQTAGNIQAMAPEILCGIYSAGLKSRDVGYPVTVAGIQSVYDKADLLGPHDIVAIDEAHRIPADGEGMYRTFLEGMRSLNPAVRLVGLTATPFRLDSGMICHPDHLLNKVCFEIGVRELIRDGWLSPLKSKGTRQKFDTRGVGLRGGEFIGSELQLAMLSDPEKVVMACIEIGERTQDRTSALVFCTGIEHMEAVAGHLRQMDLGEVRTLSGDTPSEERTRTIRDFRNRKVKYLVNVEVLTTGFDAPNVDTVAVLRPTMSPGLWCQMVGRGFRKAEGKSDCLVMDFGGNLLRHGPVDRLLISDAAGSSRKSDPWKECPWCFETVPRTCDICPDCGAKFERAGRGVGHDGQAYEGDILSGPEPVERVSYTWHKKAGSDDAHPPTLRVDYTIGMRQISEFVCLEHEGFARQKAAAWWKTRSDQPVPKTVTEALGVIEEHGIKRPGKVVLKSEGKYLRVVRALEFSDQEVVPF